MRNRQPALNSLLLIPFILFTLMVTGCNTATPPDTPRPFRLEDVEIQPLSADAYGVQIASDFMIKTAASLPVAQLQEMIRVVPEVDFSLSLESAGSYLLRLENALRSHSIFQVVLAADNQERSWAFQTQRVFGVVATLPGDDSYWVPLNRGIEIVFSHSDVPEIEPFFSIIPHVEGHFEQHGNTWVFVHGGLELHTSYEVTVSADLHNVAGLTLGTDYRFTFQTEYDYNWVQPLFLSGSYAETFTSFDLPVVELFAFDKVWSEMNYQVDVHALSSRDDYLALLEQYHAATGGITSYDESYYGYSRAIFRTDPAAYSQNLLYSFASELLRASADEWYYEPQFIVLPDLLPPGWYLVDIASIDEGIPGRPEIQLQKLIQIHDTSVYLHSTYDHLTVWLHDSLSGEPLRNTEINLNGKTVARTDDEGLAILAMPENASPRSFTWLELHADTELPFITPVTLFAKNTKPHPAEVFSSYMYTDRSAYLPSDTINVWGVVRSRTGIPLPASGIVSLLSWRQSYRYESNYSYVPIVEVPIQIDSNGIFTAALPLENIASSWYTLEFHLAGWDEAVTSSYVSVLEYVKPIYTGTLTTTKPGIFAWESVDLLSEITFFDGTPATNLSLALDIYNYPWQSQHFLGSTDEQGKYNLAFTREMESYDYYPGRDYVNWRPNYLSFYLRNDSAEDADMHLQHTIDFFETDIMLKGTWDEAAKTVTVHSNRIDLSNYPEDNNLYADGYASITGAAVNIPFSLDIVEVIWHKIEIDVVYDFINKQTVTRYRYDREDRVVKSIQGNTSDGIAVVAGVDYTWSATNYYYANLYTWDSRGTEIQEVITVGPQFYRYRETALRNYSLQADAWSVALDQSIKVNLLENGLPYTDPTGKLLYIVLQSPEGVLDSGLITGTGFDLAFEARYIPGVTLTGAYWDGRRIFCLDVSGTIAFNPEERKLDLLVTTDKDSYHPGEEVKLHVSVKDRNGKAAPADLYISVVDEAAFAIASHEASLLTSLYRWITPPRSWSYASYTQHVLDNNGMAEKGGDGGMGSLRRLFLDNALSLTLVTDASGVAETTFLLPDNLTSWRITTLAVTPDLYAGSSKLHRSASLPFFTDMLLGGRYLAGDDLSLAVRSFGTALTGDEIVNYQVFLLNSDEEVIGEWHLSERAGNYANLLCGILEPGNYFLQAYATCGEYSDALEKSTVVVSSAIELPFSRIISPEELDITALRDPVTLTFYDKNRQLQVRSAFHLLASPGVRVDQRLGVAQARSWLQDSSLAIAGWTEDESSQANMDIYFYRGGVRLLPDASEDPVLTARVAVAMPQILDVAEIIDYLFSIVENQESWPEQVVAAYMGLASLKQPILLDLQRLAANPQGLSEKDLLYLSAALALIGDSKTAAESYAVHIKPRLKQLDPWVYLDSGEGRDSDLEWTALASLSAIFNDWKAAEGMIAYLLDNSSSDLLTNLEIIAFLRLYPQQTNRLAATPVTFSYSKNGKLSEVTLASDQLHTVAMTARELQEANLQVHSGDLGITASYIGSAEEIMDQDAIRVTVSKRIEPMLGNAFRQSDLVRITLEIAFDADAPLGGYSVTEMIPSGLRFTKIGDYNWYYNRNWYMSHQEGQRVSFVINQPDLNPVTITYYARAILTGSFVVESSYVQSMRTAAWGKSPRGSLVITP